MCEMKLKPLAVYNQAGYNNHQLSMRSRVSYPTAVKYMKDEVEAPGIIYVVKLLAGLGVDWRKITLGDLISECENATD